MATTSIPQTANDVLVAFSEALGAPQDGEEQVNTLAAVRTALDDHPEYLSAIYSTLLSVTARSGAVLLRWIADVVELVIARLAVLSNALSVEQRTHSESQIFDHNRQNPQDAPVTFVSACKSCTSARASQKCSSIGSRYRLATRKHSLTSGPADLLRGVLTCMNFGKM